MRAQALAFIIIAAVVGAPCLGAEQRKAPPSHKSGICADIAKKIDLLLYEDGHHGATATCSYTDDRLLIKPKEPLPEQRMRRFVFLAFSVVGFLSNDDYMLPIRCT
jgi:hypothetical protein